MTREKWFQDRIGKRVFRNNTFCCEHCQDIFDNGLIIADKQHADYLRDCEAEWTIEGTPLNYFDTKKEAMEFNNSPRVVKLWKKAKKQTT